MTDSNDLTISVNGAPVVVQPGATVATLVAAQDLPATGVAVAVNGEVVAAGSWQLIELSPGDAIEIVTARQGG